MSSAAYLPFLIQIILAAAIGAVVIGASHFFGQRSKASAIKDSPYECGLYSEGIADNRFTARFFVTALLFLVFDIEVVFLLPWVVIYREFLANQIAIFWPILCFLGVLVLGLFYEMKKGALNWEK
ncbi:MAG: NADH-quinone oxidoreductase subunit A [Opitutaceae bacterium]|jgi:NADH-quinone oxidoreductase subunit A